MALLGAATVLEGSVRVAGATHDHAAARSHFVTNANDGNAVEINTGAPQVAEVTLIAKGAGDLFRAAIEPGSRGLLFVKDGTNAVDAAGER